MSEDRSEGKRPARPPSRRLPALAEVEAEHAEGFRFHGPRILLLLILAVTTYLLFPAGDAPGMSGYELGSVPPQDLIAEVGFQVLKSESDLRREQDAAAGTVTPVFRYDSLAADSMRMGIEARLDQFDALFEPGLTEVESKARIDAALVPFELSDRAATETMLRSPANRAILRRAADETIREDVVPGVARTSEVNAVQNERVLLRDGTERFLRRDSILTETQLWENANRHLPARAPAGMNEMLRRLISNNFKATISYDRATTERERMAMRSAVSPLKADVMKGERVVTAHERVGQDELDRQNAYKDKLSDLGRLSAGAGLWLRIAGAILINTLALAIFGLLLRLYRPGIYRSPRALLLLAFLLVTVTAAASFLTAAGLPSALIPIAFPALVAAMLWDGRMALTLALVIAILLGIQAPLGELSSRVFLVVAGAAAALSVRAVHRRAHGLILGGIVALAYLLGAVGAGALLTWDWSKIMEPTLLGTANGLASALIAVGLMPVFEAWTGITTDQTLLELGDLNRPLLKRLSLEANGTYAHSINVANLAEAAARAIGANPLLARVGSYYHDIGKIAEPEYFVENQPRNRNPHDFMPPHESAAIVRRHVTEGMRLAEDANLPARLKAFIAEHHGTQLIGFFYEKAREETGIEPDAGEFRYPGPRPTSPETAILMLADSVESAAKVLEEPTPEAIRDLVDRIVQAKLDRGELDEAPVTLRDLTRIKEQFVAVLGGLYHHRLDYPPAVTAPVHHGHRGRD